MDRVGTIATTVGSSHGGWHIVTYHETEVVRWNDKQGVVILNSGGWRTATTKTRMNQVSNQYGLGYLVKQVSGKWYVHLSDGGILDFEDNMEFAYQGVTA